MGPVKRTLWMGNRGTPTPTPAPALVDFSSLVTLVNGKSDGGLWNFQDPANLFTDTAGTTHVATAGTDKIARCNDLSSFGRPQLQATPGNRPTWNKSGSRAYGTFDRPSANWMRPASASASTTQPHVHFIVIRPSGATNGWFIGGFSAAAANLYLWDATNQSINMYNGTNCTTANGSVLAGAVTSLVLEANTTSSRPFVNGVQDGALRTSGLNGSNHITLGNDGNLSSSYYNGDILAVGWFSGILQAGDLTTIQNVLSQL